MNIMNLVKLAVNFYYINVYLESWFKKQFTKQNILMWQIMYIKLFKTFRSIHEFKIKRTFSLHVSMLWTSCELNEKHRIVI